MLNFRKGGYMCYYVKIEYHGNLVKIFFFLQHKQKYGMLHEFACHPCAGAMLIFSVSFQF